MPLRPPHFQPGRARRAVLACALATGFLACSAVTGCSGNPKPRDTTLPARYRSLGPKTDFPAYLSGTILETADVHGIEPVRISGYGVVVNLENTGRDDGIPTAVRESVLDTAQIRGIGSELTGGTMGSISGSHFLGDPRNAIVRVDGIVPPGARKGQRIDVVVSALETNTTTSLARGELWRTELHAGIVTPQSPGERVNLAGQARGRVAVNPVYALDDPMQVKEDSAAQASLRTGYIQDGAIFAGIDGGNRVIVLRLREPSWRIARAIEKRINLFYGAPVAAAQDEGLVNLVMPDRFRGDWAHFVGVTTTLFYFGVNKEYALERAAELVTVATDPSLDPTLLEGISYAWEGLGHVATPVLLPLFSDPNPAVAFWAARAAAFNEEAAAIDTLFRLAAEPGNPYAVAAAQTLGKLRSTSGLVRRLRSLLDTGTPDVRIAAYRSLVALGDFTLVGGSSSQTGAIISTAIGEKEYGKQFYLDRIESKGPPLIWASRRGTPRIVVIGQAPRLLPGSFISAFGDRLTITVSDDGRRASVFHRPMHDFKASLSIFPDAVELAATLGGQVRPGDLPVRLAYGDVLAVLKKVCDDGLMVDAAGRPVPMVLQDLATDLVDEAPSIPGLENVAAGN